jgi:hypothetical protein
MSGKSLCARAMLVCLVVVAVACSGSDRWSLENGDAGVSRQALSSEPVRPHHDLSEFVVDLGDRIRVEGFDVNPPADPASFDRFGLRVLRGNVSANSTAASPPSVLAGGAEGIAGDFAQPVRAVGVKAIGGAIELRLYDGGGQLLGTILSDTDPSTPDFVGVVLADALIARFEVVSPSGGDVQVDDLVFGPPLKQPPFEYAIDADVKPSFDTIDDPRTGTRRAGAMANPDGPIETFELDVVVFKPRDAADEQDFLKSTGGRIPHQHRSARLQTSADSAAASRGGRRALS